MKDVNLFAECLASLLTERGATALLAKRSGVSRPFISRMCSGEVLPSVEMLEKLLTGLPLQADREHLALAYVRVHVPANAMQVRVLLNEDASPKDRLMRACEMLDDRTREALAVLVEAILRAPEQGARAIQSMAELFQLPQDTRRGAESGIALLAEPREGRG